MTNSIHAFLSSRSQNNDHRCILLVKENQVVIREKKEVHRITLLMAKMGFGKASLRNVSKWVRRNGDQIEIDTHARFNRYVNSYNKGRVFWKKGKVAEPVISKEMEHPPEVLFLQMQTIYKNYPHQLENLLETIHQLSDAIQRLDPQDKKINKPFFEEILKMKAGMRSKCSKDAQLKTALKNLQSAVLKKHFAKRLARMDTVLTQLEKRFEMHQDNKQDSIRYLFRSVFFMDSYQQDFQNNRDFVKQQLKQWREQLDQGKPISIPKWFHCTKTSNLVCTIADSRIKYLHRGAYPGAFVSSRPEVSYGNYGIAMSDQIEKTGTKGNNKSVMFPKQSNFYGDIRYGEVNDDLTPEFQNKQSETCLWLGFQKKSGIPLKHRKVSQKPLEYYKDNSLSYIFYHYSYQNDIDKLHSFGKKHKIAVVSLTELHALQALINATYELSLPEHWEGNIKKCGRTFF